MVCIGNAGMVGKHGHEVVELTWLVMMQATAAPALSNVTVVPSVNSVATLTGYGTVDAFNSTERIKVYLRP